MTCATSIADPRRIPKTIIFFDSKREADDAAEALHDFLRTHEQHRYSTAQAEDTVQVFTADIHDFDKQCIVSEMQKAGSSSSIRVICATEALGLGVDLPDIRRLVQYGIPRSPQIAVFSQRVDRACRDGNDGEILLLVDEWAIGEAIGERAKCLPKRRETEKDELRRKKRVLSLLFKLFGGPIDWVSRKQQTVTTSTTEAELLSLQHAAKELQSWRHLFSDLELDLEQPEDELQCDNLQTVRLVTLDRPIVKTNIRHIHISDLWVREEHHRGNINVTWVETSRMAADGLTKPLPKSKFEQFIKQLGMEDVSSMIG